MQQGGAQGVDWGRARAVRRAVAGIIKGIEPRDGYSGRQGSVGGGRAGGKERGRSCAGIEDRDRDGGGQRVGLDWSAASKHGRGWQLTPLSAAFACTSDLIPLHDRAFGSIVMGSTPPPPPRSAIPQGRHKWGTIC